jgi:primary-amine oxidase
VGERTRFAYRVLDSGREGQPPIMLEDLMAVDEIVKCDDGWRAEMERT